jgi:hypothetical protein
MIDNPYLASAQRRQAEQQDAVARTASIPIKDPRGGVITVGAAVADMQYLHRTIGEETREGSERHRRISQEQRLVRRLLPALEGVILFWFLAGVLNADLRTLDPTFAVAAAFAVLCTIVVAAWISAVGEHLQRSKDDCGDLAWEHLDGTSWTMLTITGVMMLFLGVLMYVRVSDEVYQAAGVHDVAIMAVAITLAAAVVLLNVYVLYLSFRDGSVMTRDLDRLGRAVGPHLRRQHRARSRAQAAARRIEVRVLAERRVAPRRGLP